MMTALAPIEITLCLGMASKNFQFLFMIIAYSCKIRGQICISTLGIGLVGPGLQAPMDDGY